MRTSQNHLPSLLSTLLFVLGALLLFGTALLMGITALASLFAGVEVKAQQTILFITFGFEALVLLAAAFFSFQKFLQKPAADQDLSVSTPYWLIAVFVIFAAGSIAGGYLVGKAQGIDWLLLPILTIPAIVLPLAAFWAFGTKRLPLGTRWQTWSVLGLAMTLVPLVLFILEILIAIVIVSIVVIYIVSQPDLVSELQGLSQQLRLINPNSQAALDLLAPLLTKPAVIIVALIYLAGLVPAVEEIFKPLGVWLFAGKLGSQAQGFALGALSGAGYGLIETIGVSGQTTDWASLLFSRIGTGLLHITTSALMGGAIVLAWRERRYARLLGTYLLAVLLHGLWNSVALLFGFSNLMQLLGHKNGLTAAQPEFMAGLVILALGLFTILVLSNLRLRQSVASPPVVVPQESADTHADLP